MKRHILTETVNNADVYLGSVGVLLAFLGGTRSGSVASLSPGALFRFLDNDNRFLLVGLANVSMATNRSVVDYIPL